MLAVMLGVFNAGKFFVVLDPLFPKERLAVLLDDALAAMVVTDRQKCFVGPANDYQRLPADYV
jgi:acyl-CoA synthetase (AMP-forming)/AMP-acid ligase II